MGNCGMEARLSFLYLFLLFQSADQVALPSLDIYTFVRSLHMHVRVLRGWVRRLVETRKREREKAMIVIFALSDVIICMKRCPSPFVSTSITHSQFFYLVYSM